MNIHRVLEYKALEHLFDSNPNKLTILMFSSKLCKPCTSIRPVFLDLSKKYLDCVFVYIDVNDFVDTVNFLEEINKGGVPQFHYYFNKNHLAFVEGADVQLLVDTLSNLHKKITQLTKEIVTTPKVMQPEVTITTPEVIPKSVSLDSVNTSIPELTGENLRHDKLVMLKKLYDLTKRGIKLTTVYTIDSDIDDMQWEYNIHTNLTGIVVGGSTNILSISSDKDYQELEKQKKINDIQTLATMNNLNKQKQLSCIEQLLQIKRQKERME